MAVGGDCGDPDQVIAPRVYGRPDRLVGGLSIDRQRSPVHDKLDLLDGGAVGRVDRSFKDDLAGEQVATVRLDDLHGEFGVLRVRGRLQQQSAGNAQQEGREDVSSQADGVLPCA